MLLSSTRKYTLLSSYWFCLSKREVKFNQNCFHFRHLEKDFSWARPVISDVPHCFRVTLIPIKVVLSKCRKLKFSQKKKSILISTLKRYFLKQWCIKLTSDNRPSLDHSGTHLTSLGEFDSTVFSKMAEMKFILLKLNVSFRTKKLITTKQRILSQLSYYRIISILQK